MPPRNSFRLSEAPDHLPRKGGRKIAVATVYRWAARGHRGVRLETVSLPSGRFTSAAAIRRFMGRLSDSPAQPAQAQAERQRRADAALDAALA